MNIWQRPWVVLRWGPSQRGVGALLTEKDGISFKMLRNCSYYECFIWMKMLLHIVTLCISSVLPLVGVIRVIRIFLTSIILHVYILFRVRSTRLLALSCLGLQFCFVWTGMFSRISALLSIRLSSQKLTFFWNCQEEKRSDKRRNVPERPFLKK